MSQNRRRCLPLALTSYSTAIGPNSHFRMSPDDDNDDGDDNDDDIDSVNNEHLIADGR